MDTNPTYRELTDYALDVVRCKAKQLVGKAGYKQDDMEDIKQELIVDLLERLPKFDSSKASYNTFVARVVERRISNLLRDRQAEMRDHRREICSLNEEIDTGEEEPKQRLTAISQDEQDFRTGKYQRSAEERMDLHLDIQNMLAGLPPDLRNAARLLQHRPIAQVARELGIPHATFYDHHLTQLREAFAEQGLADYLG